MNTSITASDKKEFIATAVSILCGSSVRHSFDWMNSFKFHKEEMQAVVSEVNKAYPSAAKKLQGLIDAHEFPPVVLYFVAKIYCMYDGKEFPRKDLIEASDEKQAFAIATERAATGHYSFDQIEDVDGDCYYSDCGGHVVKVISVTEVSETTYTEMKNIG